MEEGYNSGAIEEQQQVWTRAREVEIKEGWADIEVDYKWNAPLEPYHVE